MCGIVISSKYVEQNFCNIIQKRGPDATNYIEYNGFHFIHYLLHITGSKTLQPIIDNNVVYIFNGEIYNYKTLLETAESDIFAIIDVYKKYGSDFVKYLDGEFTIVVMDFNSNKLFISSDIFKTKPLFYSVNNESVIIASYESTCKKIIDQSYNSIEPNELLIFDLNNRTLIEKKTIHTFDLNQHKTDYNDFNNALENAILKRYPEHSMPVISLSSGLDSGTIAKCLFKHNKPSYFYSFIKGENPSIINQRVQILGENATILQLTNEDKTNYLNYLNDNCEPFNWDWTYNPRVNRVENGFKMGSMLGKSKILSVAKEKDSNVNVYFSGIGADEVMAHNCFYSCGYGNVDKFPEKLNDVFPWPNFFKGSMENYINGDEYVGGSYSYETRYPYCDTQLIQEFLWLIPDLKNTYNGIIYKPPLLHYLDKVNGFPVCRQKKGFAP